MVGKVIIFIFVETKDNQFLLLCVDRMAYTNGTFQYFDNTYLWDRADFRKPVQPRYDPSTLFGYLQTHHKKWLLVLQRAGKEDVFGFRPNGALTMFVPLEESIPDELVVGMDKSVATALFNYHTMRGAYDQASLETARFQHLHTLTDGASILYTHLPGGSSMLNRSRTIVQPNIQFGNVIIHVISGILY